MPAEDWTDCVFDIRQGCSPVKGVHQGSEVGRHDFRKDRIVAGGSGPAFEQAADHHRDAVHHYCCWLPIVREHLRITPTVSAQPGNIYSGRSKHQQNIRVSIVESWM